MQKNDNVPKKNNPEYLSEERMECVCRKIIHYLETKKIYLKPDYSLWELSRETGFPTAVVSRSINHYMGRNFYDLINRMRLEEAKKLLREAAERRIRVNITDVGIQSGFSSRSVFFSRFNEYEGMTPKKYMNLYLIN